MTVLFANRKTCKYMDVSICDSCRKKDEINCTNAMYEESDVLAAVTKLKEELQKDINWIKKEVGADVFNKIPDFYQGELIGLDNMMERIHTIFGVPKQSETGDSSAGSEGKHLHDKEPEVIGTTSEGHIIKLAVLEGGKHQDFQCPSEGCLSSCRCCCDCPEQSTEKQGLDNSGSVKRHDLIIFESPSVGSEEKSKPEQSEEAIKEKSVRVETTISTLAFSGSEENGGCVGKEDSQTDDRQSLAGATPAPATITKEDIERVYEKYVVPENQLWNNNLIYPMDTEVLGKMINHPISAMRAELLEIIEKAEEGGEKNEERS